MRVVSNTERHLLGLGCERLVDGLFTGCFVQSHIDFGDSEPRPWPRPSEVLRNVWWERHQLGPGDFQGGLTGFQP